MPAKRKPMSRLLNFAMFYLGWFSCVVGAARGKLWLGPVTASALLLAHLALTPTPAREARLILVVGLFGFAVDTSQASAGLFAFAGTSIVPWLCPLWMAALWMLFATTLNSSMSWLAGRYRLAAVLGALCGPVSYAAGARLGAIHFPEQWLPSLVGVAAAWAAAMPALLLLRDLLSGPQPERAPGYRARALEVAK
jgi:hypothetical protein